MNTQNIMDCERKSIGKLVNFRLPHRFMMIGMAVTALSIALMLVRAFVLEMEDEWFKDVLRKSLLVGMLLMSLSRDKQEDEMTISLRSQSYAIAFVVGVVYALVMPYVDYGVSNVLKPEGEALKDLGDFQVLVFMLLVQLLFYHNLKRFR